MKGQQESLATVVIKGQNWMTPEAQNSTGYQISNGVKVLCLGSQVMSGLADQGNRNSVGSRQESWLTPNTMDSLPVRSEEALAKQYNKNRKGRTTHSTLMHQATPPIGMKLNPRWVEVLMGLPVGWVMPSCISPVTIAPTNSDSSETELFQPQQNSHSELFGRNYNE